MPDRERTFGNELVAVLGNFRKPCLVLFVAVDRRRIDVAGRKLLRPRLGRRFRPAAGSGGEVDGSAPAAFA